MSDDGAIAGPLPHVPGECWICGSPAGVDCIPECDADDLTDIEIANLSITRLIERGGRWPAATAGATDTATFDGIS